MKSLIDRWEKLLGACEMDFRRLLWKGALIAATVFRLLQDRDNIGGLAPLSTVRKE